MSHFFEKCGIVHNSRIYHSNGYETTLNSETVSIAKKIFIYPAYMIGWHYITENENSFIRHFSIEYMIFLRRNLTLSLISLFMYIYVCIFAYSPALHHCVRYFETSNQSTIFVAKSFKHNVINILFDKLIDFETQTFVMVKYIHICIG
jgi:hypothetical protein